MGGGARAPQLSRGVRLHRRPEKIEMSQPQRKWLTLAGWFWIFGKSSPVPVAMIFSGTWPFVNGVVNVSSVRPGARAAA